MLYTGWLGVRDPGFLPTVAGSEAVIIFILGSLLGAQGSSWWFECEFPLWHIFYVLICHLCIFFSGMPPLLCCPFSGPNDCLL